MDIKRIDDYDDSRFKETVLKQHGAFLIDDIFPFEVEIINDTKAIIRGPIKNYFWDVIDDFRFYSSFVSEFYDDIGNLIKEYEKKEFFEN